MTHESVEEITERAVRAASRARCADRPRLALDYLEDALDADPKCYEALVMAGEVCDLYEPELGFEEGEGSWMALTYLKRAIAQQPDNAEAYAEMSMALLHLEEYASAIETADKGISFFDQPPVTDNPYDVWVNIGESLYRMKALALLRRGDPTAGREVLCEGFRRFPDSEYLTQAAEEFLPEF